MISEPIYIVTCNKRGCGNSIQIKKSSLFIEEEIKKQGWKIEHSRHFCKECSSSSAGSRETRLALATIELADTVGNIVISIAQSGLINESWLQADLETLQSAKNKLIKISEE